MIQGSMLKYVPYKSNTMGIYLYRVYSHNLIFLWNTIIVYHNSALPTHSFQGVWNLIYPEWSRGHWYVLTHPLQYFCDSTAIKTRTTLALVGLPWMYAHSFDSGCGLASYPGSLGATLKEPGYETSCGHGEDSVQIQHGWVHCSGWHIHEVHSQ